MKRKKKKQDKSRSAKVHAEQMKLLWDSADHEIPLQDRLAILYRLKPKYLMRAIDETFELKCLPGKSRLKMLGIRERLWAKELTVKQAMDIMISR